MPSAFEVNVLDFGMMGVGTILNKTLCDVCIEMMSSRAYIKLTNGVGANKLG
jgi:hypothetical protein